jgi:hypothetical protein
MVYHWKYKEIGIYKKSIEIASRKEQSQELEYKGEFSFYTFCYC